VFFERSLVSEIPTETSAALLLDLKQGRGKAERTHSTTDTLLVATEATALAVAAAAAAAAPSDAAVTVPVAGPAVTPPRKSRSSSTSRIPRRTGCNCSKRVA
jgi:hypothetical protein